LQVLARALVEQGEVVLGGQVRFVWWLVLVGFFCCFPCATADKTCRDEDFFS
jgi:hypothetical protein